jgi:hypothetical protein
MPHLWFHLSRKWRAPAGGLIAPQAGIGAAAAAGAPLVAATGIGRTPWIDAGCTELQRCVWLVDQFETDYRCLRPLDRQCLCAAACFIRQRGYRKPTAALSHPSGDLFLAHPVTRVDQGLRAPFRPHTGLQRRSPHGIVPGEALQPPGYAPGPVFEMKSWRVRSHIEPILRRPLGPASV